jgi:hypothetical protein
MQGLLANPRHDVIRRREIVVVVGAAAGRIWKILPGFAKTMERHASWTA